MGLSTTHLIIFLVIIVLIFVVPGWIAWIVIGLWYLYRCLRGWIAFNDRRAMPA